MKRKPKPDSSESETNCDYTKSSTSTKVNPTDQLLQKGSTDLFHWRLPVGYGNYEFHDQWFRRDNPLSSSAPECFVIGRKAVQTGNITVIDWLLAPSRLARWRGRIHFAIEGYGNDDREIYKIPEVRAFFTSLFEYLSCGIYFASMADCRPIQLLAACVTDPLMVGKKRGCRNVLLQTSETPLRQFCISGFEIHNGLCEMANVPASEALEQFANTMEFLTGRPK